MEKVIVAKSRTVDPEKTKICCTRYGNVMCSRGSVIPLWIEQIKAGKGFVGKNLAANLYCIKDGKNRTRDLTIDEIFEYDIDTEESLLDTYCEKADFVFNLAGVNRPKEQSEFMDGNFGFASKLLDTLKKHHNTCPVMLSSSIQATLIGRYGQSDYGKSKLAGEELFFEYGKECGAKVLVYRFPNLFGKWCRPNYNSAVATFCNNIANNLPIQVNDRATELELLYIDDLVEEIVDIISDVNMAYSEHARRYLADCGLPKERTYVTGSPMAEVLHDNLEKIEASDVHARLGLEKGKYILLSAHREENIDTEKNFLSLFEAINKIAEKYDMPILYSCHPRSRKRLEASGFQLDKRVIQHEPLGFHDYNCLQMNAFAVVSDSGTLPEESSFFTSVGHPFPAVCIRTSTERPEALDKGCFVLAGIDSNSLVQAVETAVAMNENGDYGIPVPDYVEENVSTKVVKIIQSYTGVVNKMVWRKF